MRDTTVPEVAGRTFQILAEGVSAEDCKRKLSDKAASGEFEFVRWDHTDTASMTLAWGKRAAKKARKIKTEGAE